jgi:CHAD domain-containing protein
VSEELELKYDVDDPDAMAASLDEWFPPAGGVAWRETRLEDLVFDTPDLDLLRAGYGARVRSVGGQRTVTLKATVEVKGARHLRTEIDGPAGEGLTTDEWPASTARDLLREVVGGARLTPRFCLRQLRRERELQLKEGSVLASLDDVAVHGIDGTLVGRLRGLEVELLAGRRRALRRAAKRIEASGLATVQPLSKMQLAHALVAAREPLRSEELWADAGRKVLARHFLRMLDREAATRAGDALALKQMRVATRRMRAVWRVFDGAYKRSEQRRYVAELRDVADHLGAVRDLDVIIERLPADTRLQRLADAWRVERTRAMERLLEHLESAEYARFVEDHRAFVGSPTAAVGRAGLKRRLSDVAGERIDKSYAELLRIGRELRDDDLPTFHALRIAGKRLRYTLETFRDLLPPEPVARCHARLVALQDALGALNDQAVAADRVVDWLAGPGSVLEPAERAPIEAYVDRLGGQLAPTLAEAQRLWRAVASPTFQNDLEALVAAASRSELTAS